MGGKYLRKTTLLPPENPFKNTQGLPGHHGIWLVILIFFAPRFSNEGHPETKEKNGVGMIQN